MYKINNISVKFKPVKHKDGKTRFEIDYTDMIDIETGAKLKHDVLDKIALFSYDEVIYTVLPTKISIHVRETNEYKCVHETRNNKFTIGEILNIVVEEENKYINSLNPDSNILKECYFSGINNITESTFEVLYDSDSDELNYLGGIHMNEQLLSFMTQMIMN